jgi:K+-transporting ATPase ATPase C chain
MFSTVVPAVRMLVVLSVLTGIVYPLVVTGLAQVAFPWRANGSLIEEGGRILGSRLIGQPFSGAGYFWSRPSATAPQPYNAAASAGSNQGARNPALAEAVAARVRALREADPQAIGPVPADLVTASASGLDPHISAAAAEFQLARVARARGLPLDEVRSVVDAHTEGPAFGLLGEKRVNVLGVNLELDRMAGKR